MKSFPRILAFTARVRMGMCIVFVAAAALNQTLYACPNCKEATMPETGISAATGFSSSILFMMSMPFIVLAVFGIRIWLSARRRAAGEAR